MIFDINSWLEEIQTKVYSAFKSRVLFMGCQGSYNRGEATKDSDIDIVLILDSVNIEDLKIYRKIVHSMPHSDKACGFISGKDEISNWSKADIFQFVYDTRALLGDINTIIAPLRKSDVKNAIKVGAENLYHGACHSFLYDKNAGQTLAELYKGVFFIIQAKYFFKADEYIPTKKELMEKLSPEDKTMLQTCIDRKSIASKSAKEVEDLYEMLISYCSKLISL